MYSGKGVLVVSLILFSGVFLGSAWAQQPTNISAAEPYEPDTPGGSHADSDLRIPGPNPDGWWFPLTRLDQLLPHWIQFGGQFRDRAANT
jgi:hypothetical protein